jgi:hypothetical protein
MSEAPIASVAALWYAKPVRVEFVATLPTGVFKWPSGLRPKYTVFTPSVELMTAWPLALAAAPTMQAAIRTHVVVRIDWSFRKTIIEVEQKMLTMARIRLA